MEHLTDLARPRSLALVLALTALTAACGGSPGARTAAGPPTAPAPPAATAPAADPVAEPASTAPTTASPTTTRPATAAPPTAAAPKPTAPPTTAPPPTAAPPTTTPPATTPPRTPAYDVAAVQRRLTELHYYVGRADGRPGAALRSAVMAFQKVNRLTPDGTVGPKVLAALQQPVAPALREPGPGRRVEVDLTRQVLYVAQDGQITRVLPVSSGSGATYRQASGRTARALTPVGHFRVERRIVGVREADLGTLYDPQYFYRGWAIHGSGSVPAGPASHGCVRVTRADGTWLLGQIGVGSSVFLYGGTHVFPAGSAAAGTDDPTGDEAGT